MNDETNKINNNIETSVKNANNMFFSYLISVEFFNGLTLYRQKLLIDDMLKKGINNNFLSAIETFFSSYHKFSNRIECFKLQTTNLKMALQHIKEIDTQLFLGIKTRNLFKLGSKSVNSIDPISHFSDILVELKYPSSSYESN